MVFDLLAGVNMPLRCNAWHLMDNSQFKGLGMSLRYRYGVYINYLATLSEEQSIVSVDRAWLKGYCSKWMNFKMLIGAAMYTDILKSLSCLS